MRAIPKKAVAGSLLGTAVVTAVAQAAEFSRDYTADWLPMPPSVTVPVVASVAASYYLKVSMPETILEDADDHRGDLERSGSIQIIDLKRGSI
jgi:hypothetical protein